MKEGEVACNILKLGFKSQNGAGVLVSASLIPDSFVKFVFMNGCLWNWITPPNLLNQDQCIIECVNIKGEEWINNILIQFIILNSSVQFKIQFSAAWLTIGLMLSEGFWAMALHFITEAMKLLNLIQLWIYDWTKLPSTSYFPSVNSQHYPSTSLFKEYFSP